MPRTARKTIMIKYQLCLCLCALCLSTPLSAQTVELSTRTFWVGDRPKTMDSDTPYLALRDIDWIEAILGTDPVLKDAVVHIELNFVSVAQFVAAPEKDEIPLGPDRVPPQFRLPDYTIYGSPVLTSKSFTYLPAEPGAGFIVFCGQRDDVEKMMLCVVYSAYTPDDRIRLKARLYFPPDPAQVPTYFRDVVQRMRDVAYCLDVTDKLVDVPVVHPALSGCQTKPTS